MFEVLKSIEPSNGLYPIFVKNMQKDVRFSGSKVTFGSMGDSYYEYMLKMWLQGGKKENVYREMYDKAVDGLHLHLLEKTKRSGLTYIAEMEGGHMIHQMGHLACFMAGSLALGAYTDPAGLDSVRAQRDLQTGKALAYTCYQMYAMTNTGLSPETVTFGKDMQVKGKEEYYILRPEVIESMFILNQLTGDPIYREWGWEMFQAIERYCKTKFAYGTKKNVNRKNEKPEDKMESFFLAETLKYHFLLQDPDTEVDILNKHVFNTEAHPLRFLDEVKSVDLVYKYN